MRRSPSTTRPYASASAATPPTASSSQWFAVTSTESSIAEKAALYSVVAMPATAKVRTRSTDSSITGA